MPCKFNGGGTYCEEEFRWMAQMRQVGHTLQTNKPSSTQPTRIIDMIITDAFTE